MTNGLSWHLQIFVMISYAGMELQCNEIAIAFELSWEKRAPGDQSQGPSISLMIAPVYIWKLVKCLKLNNL